MKDTNTNMWNFLDSYFNTEVVYQKLDNSLDSGFAEYATIIMIVVATCSIAFLVFQQLMQRAFLIEDDNDNEPNIITNYSEKCRTLLSDQSADDEELLALVGSYEPPTQEEEIAKK